jgi:crossover junction endodeoxyribonuclease RusA
MTISFIVYGEPAPQSSKTFRGFSHGKPILAEASKKVDPWRREVKHAAILAGDGFDVPLLGPLHALFVFTLRRPLRPEFEWPAVVPDISKLVRSTEDAITESGLWKDDSQVVIETSFKVYPGGHQLALERPGCTVVIETIGVDQGALFRRNG